MNIENPMDDKKDIGQEGTPEAPKAKIGEALADMINMSGTREDAMEFAEFTDEELEKVQELARAYIRAESDKDKEILRGKFVKLYEKATDRKLGL